MSAATKGRTSAAVSADIEARKAREVALTAQLATVREALTSIRADRARAVADGKPGPSAGAIAALVEEASGLESALELIAGEIERLEAERATVVLVEAEQAERDAIAAARDALDALDETVRALAEEEILPLADGLLDALREAHDAERETERLRRLKDPSAPSIAASRADRVMHRRSELLQAIDAMRRLVTTSSAVQVSVKPVVGKESEEDGPAVARAS